MISRRASGPVRHSRSRRTIEVMALDRSLDRRSLNRADRLRAALDRDGPTCIWCARTFRASITATTEHVIPRVKGGPSWLDNEVAACRRCNSERGHRGAVDWLEECERRGWEPDELRLLRVLTGLADAIAREGGQRRARPHVDAQLRRLRRRMSPAPLLPRLA